MRLLSLAGFLGLAKVKISATNLICIVHNLLIVREATWVIVQAALATCMLVRFFMHAC